MKNWRLTTVQRKKMMLFIKVLLISLLAFSIFIFAGFMIYRSLAKPPEIPPIEDNTPNYDEPAFFTPDAEEEDMHIGGGLHAPEGFTSEDRKDDFYTFLIFGLDKGGNTDSIMIASYDGVNKEANIIGIPRDSLVNVKRRIKKINAAYPAGVINGGDMEDGVGQLKREIKTIIGFVPDYYVCVDLNAFEQIVDAVGGIDVYVPLNMELNDPGQNLYIDIKKGDQHLNGEEALKFARYRLGKTAISDYQRIENQQSVIKAVLDKLLRPSSLLKIATFIDIFTKNVSTDIKADDMLWFADQLNYVRGADALSTHTLPTDGTSGQPMYYEYLDGPAIVELVNKTINPYKKDIQEKDLDIIRE